MKVPLVESLDKMRWATVIPYKDARSRIDRMQQTNGWKRKRTLYKRQPSTNYIPTLSVHNLPQ